MSPTEQLDNRARRPHESAAGRLVLLLTLAGLSGCAAPSAAREAAPSEAPPAAPAGLDCHVHLPSLETDPAVAAAVLGALDEAGLGRACLLGQGGHTAPGCEDRSCADQEPFTRRANDFVLELARSAGGRLLPFCGIPVTAGFAAREVERCAGAGARGLKLHLVREQLSLVEQEHAAHQRRLDAVFAKAGEHGLAVLVHVAMEDEAEVRALFALTRKHPSTVVIAAHQVAPSLALLPEAPPNLWIEVSGLTHAPAEAGEYFVPAWRAFGMHRILLGSDWPQLSPAGHREMLERYPLTDEERAQIIHANGARLFD